MENQHDIWNEQKKYLSTKKLYKIMEDGTKTPRTPIKEWEVWWCKLGVNIGNELYGKWSQYTRPVLIVKKISWVSCIVIPATSQPKEWTWFYPLSIEWKQWFLVFPQIRMISSARFTDKIWEIGAEEMSKIRKKAGEFYGFT